MKIVFYTASSLLREFLFVPAFNYDNNRKLRYFLKNMYYVNSSYTYICAYVNKICNIITAKRFLEIPRKLSIARNRRIAWNRNYIKLYIRYDVELTTSYLLPSDRYLHRTRACVDKI